MHLVFDGSLSSLLVPIGFCTCVVSTNSYRIQTILKLKKHNK